MTYNKIKILNKKEKLEIERKLKKQFGISEIPGIILQRGKERLFLFNGNFSKNEIREIEFTLPLERAGIYFAKIIEKTNEIRLSLEGVQLLKEQISKNIFELNKEQVNQWMHGEELNISTNKRGFLIIKYNKDFLGCGKASENKISNFIPKNRRLKNKKN